MPRGELLPAVLKLDEKLSRERGLPRLFRGKVCEFAYPLIALLSVFQLPSTPQTPLNTASAILTENRDSLFVPVDIPGSKKQHFKLAYEPGNFDSALENYNKWMKQLIEHDWPILFHPYLRDSKGSAVQTAGVEASIDGTTDYVAREGAVKAEEVRKALEKLEDVNMEDVNGQALSPGKKRKREGGDEANGRRLHMPAVDGNGSSETSHDSSSIVNGHSTNGTVSIAESPGYDPAVDQDVVIPKSLDEVVEVGESTVSIWHSLFQE